MAGFSWEAGRDMNALSGGSSAPSTAMSDSNIDGFSDLSRDNFTMGGINYKSYDTFGILSAFGLIIGGLFVLRKVKH